MYMYMPVSISQFNKYISAFVDMKMDSQLAQVTEMGLMKASLMLVLRETLYCHATEGYIV